jgi:uncharacterized membrane protein YiaA
MTENKELFARKESHADLRNAGKPSNAFVAASWIAIMVGITSYFIGLWNSGLALSEKGYFFTIILFGLFAVISVQKAVRDRLEGVPVTDIYYGLS